MPSKKRIDNLANKIEAELRACISTEPYPFYTNINWTCDFCYVETTRDKIKVVVDSTGIFDEAHACLECVDKLGLTVSCSDKALEFEARTIAIFRIRQSTEPMNLKGGE